MIKDIVQVIIDTESARVFDSFLTPPPSIESKAWIGITFLIFSSLVRSTRDMVHITHLVQISDFSLQQIMIAIKTLQARNLIYWRDLDQINWPIPILPIATKITLASPLLEMMLKQAEEDFPEKMKSVIQEFKNPRSPQMTTTTTTTTTTIESIV